MLASFPRMTVKASRLEPLLVWPLLCAAPFSSGVSAQPELRRGVAAEDEIVEVNVISIDVSASRSSIPIRTALSASKSWL